MKRKHIGEARRLRSEGASRGEHQIALRRFVAEVYHVLGHPTRIHIVECLRDKEMSVGSLLELIGVEPSNLSQHLNVLRSKMLVTSRKDGNQVWYSLRNPMLIEVLETMRRYFQAHLEEAHQMLTDMKKRQT